MKKILLIIPLLSLILPFTSFSSNVVSSSETIEYWNKVLINRQKKIAYLRNDISTFVNILDKKYSDLNKSKEFTEVKFQQLKFILLTSLNSPYVFRLTVKGTDPDRVRPRQSTDPDRV